MARRSKKARGNDRVDPFMAESPCNVHACACLWVLLTEPDVGANPISSMGDGALFHGAGAGSAGAGAGTDSSGHDACKRACLGASTTLPDVGANPIFSVGDGALLHGAGATAGAGSIGTGAVLSF